jgi:hypothetical protein
MCFCAMTLECEMVGHMLCDHSSPTETPYAKALKPNKAEYDC